MTKTYSVIIPTYNAARFLSETLESLWRAVGERQDIEIIVVDDGSTDATPAILAEAAADQRVQVITQANSGVSAARNTGLAVASGHWVTFVDADDLLPNDAFTVYDLAPADADIVYCKYRELDPVPVVGLVPSKPDEVAATEVTDLIPLLQRVLLTTDVRDYPWLGKVQLGSPWAKLFRREFLAASEIEFPDGLRLGEDQVFNLTALYGAASAAYVSAPTYFYRRADGSATNQYHPNYLDQALALETRVAEAVTEQAESHPEITAQARTRRRERLRDAVLNGPLHPRNPAPRSQRRAEFRTVVAHRDFADRAAPSAAETGAGLTLVDCLINARAFARLDAMTRLKRALGGK